MVQNVSYFMIALWQLYSFLSYYLKIMSTFGKNKSEPWDNSVKIIMAIILIDHEKYPSFQSLILAGIVVIDCIVINR